MRLGPPVPPAPVETSARARWRLCHVSSALRVDPSTAAQPTAVQRSPPPAVPVSPWAPPGHWEQLAPTRVLTDEQRLHYFIHGYLHLPAHLSAEWLHRINAVTNEFIEFSRSIVPGSPGGFPDREAARDPSMFFVLEPEHTAELPRLTRLTSPVDLHDTYWEYTNGPAAAIAVDLLGPHVKFHHSKLNFKWKGGGDEVKWHQDIQFWPHSTFTPLTIGLYLNDVTDEMGPLGVVPLSSYNELSPLEDEHTGNWTGVLPGPVVKRLPLEEAVYLSGSAGTITVHNARCVHGSRPNDSDVSRPLLLNTFTTASSRMLPFGTNPLHENSVRGTPVIRGEPRPPKLDDRVRDGPWAPNFATGYTPPFFAPDEEGEGEKIEKKKGQVNTLDITKPRTL